MLRPSQRLSTFLRSGLRTNLVAHVPQRAVVTRRMMSSHGGHSAGGDEKYWRIGSALVFLPALLYLLSPSARKTAHKHPVEHEYHTETETEAVAAVASHGKELPMTDDEGVAVSGEEVKESIEQALTEDSPKAAQEHEEVAAATPSEPSTEPEPTAEGKKDDTPEEPNPGPELEEAEDSKTDASAPTSAPADVQGEPERPATEQGSTGES